MNATDATIPEHATPEHDADSSATPEYELVLYVSGQTEHSRRALTNLSAIGKSQLEGRYRLEVVDLYRQPERAGEHGILFLPTLVKLLPLPVRRIIGDLDDEQQVMIGLGRAPRPPD
jgi:circadian clock protein KaiB